MLNEMAHFIGIIFPITVVYIIYRQNKLNSEYFYNNKIKYSKSYYLTLFLATLYFSQYFIHFTIPKVDSLHDYLSITNNYITSANDYFTFDNFINNTIKFYFYSIPLTILLYVAIDSITKLQSFEATLIFIILIEPLQYIVNIITVSQYHYISFLDIVYPCLGAGLGMLILFFVPQITRFKEQNFAPKTSAQS